MNKQAFGKKGEGEVLRHLMKNGYSHITSNYRSGRLEIDIVVLKNSVLCFVEVKTRNSGEESFFGRPSEAVNLSKQRNIIRASAAFIGEYKNKIEFDDIRYDVAEVSYINGKARINYIDNAFYKTGRKH